MQLCNHAPSHEFVGKNTLKEFKFLHNALYLMSLFNHRTVIHHLVVMKTFHDVQFTACICCTKFCIQCIPQSLSVIYVHVHITQTVSKNTQNASHKHSIGFPEFSLIFVSHSLWSTNTNVENFQSSKPERGLHLPPLKVHTGKLIRPQCISESSHT